MSPWIRGAGRRGSVILFMAVGLLLPANALAARVWQPPARLSAPGADAWIGKEVPSLAEGPGGRVIVAWREGARDASAVKVAEKPLVGPPTSPVVLGAAANPPSVAATASGRAFVAWVGSGPGGGWGDTVLV